MAPGLSHSSPKMPTGPSESDLRRLQMEQESSGVRRAVEEEVKRNVNREFETLLVNYLDRLLELWLVS